MGALRPRVLRWAIMTPLLPSANNLVAIVPDRAPRFLRAADGNDLGRPWAGHVTASAATHPPGETVCLVFNGDQPLPLLGLWLLLLLLHWPAGLGLQRV